jgi:hypothetical protein
VSEEVVASSVVACVSRVRGVWNRARRARIRDMASSNGFVGSSTNIQTAKPCWRERRKKGGVDCTTSPIMVLR